MLDCERLGHVLQEAVRLFVVGSQLLLLLVLLPVLAQAATLIVIIVDN